MMTLPRSLSLFDGLSLVIGSILGSGIFASPGLVFRRTESGGLALLVWAVGGLVAQCGALAYVELGSSLPSAGGEVTYLKRAFGPFASFLFMWSNVLIGRPAGFAITAIVVGENACRFTTGWSGAACHGSHAATSLALLSIGLCALLTATSTRGATFALSLTLSTTIIAMAGISLAGLDAAMAHKPSYADTRLDFAGSQHSLIQLGPAFMAAMWAYDGWNSLNYSTEEMVDPRQLVKVIWISIPLIAVLYICVNAAYLVILPLDVVATSDSMGVDAALAVFGRIGERLMPIVIALSAFGSCVGNLFVGARIVYSSAKDGLLPSWLAEVNASTQTPLRGVLLETVLAVACLALGNIERLIAFFSAATWFFYLLTVLGLCKLRWDEPDLARPTKTSAPVVAFFLISALLMLVLQGIFDPASYLLATVLLAFGAAYFRFVLVPRSSLDKLAPSNGSYGSL